MKKILILETRENDLRRLLARGATESKLFQAAAMVREARMRAIRAKKAQVTPHDTPERKKRIANLDAKLQTVLATTPETVLAEFKSQSSNKTKL